MRLLQNEETVLLNRCSIVESNKDQNQLMVKHVGQQLTTPEEGADFPIGVAMRKTQTMAM